LIRRIRGQLVEVGTDYVLLQADHLCYEVLVAPATAEALAEQPIGSDLELHTHYFMQMEKTRTIPLLIGFESPLQREFFDALGQVPRFGPRSALRSMSISMQTYARAIETGDATILRTLPGVGATTARAIIAQLQGKLGRFITEGDSGPLLDEAALSTEAQRDVIEALRQLGISQSDAVRMVLALEESGVDIDDPEEMLKVVFRQ